MTDLQLPRKLLLVDGTAVAYRAYFAIPALSTAYGIPTNAVYGFIRMLEQLEKQWRPDGLLVTFDGGRPEARLAECPTYKAQRAAMPEALRGQFADMEEYLRLRGMPSIRMEKEEADDLLASLSHEALLGGTEEVLIATGDKDMFQLVSDRVCVVPVHKSSERIGAAQVKERTGVPPALIVEWLALTGDTVDNLPGVPGVGPKTAAKWMLQVGSIDALWEQLDQINPPRFREVLRLHRPVVERNLRLMRLRSDLPCPEGWPLLHRPGVDRAGLKAFYRRLELHSLLKDLSEPFLL
jgi:DNA polymerase I